MFDAREIGKTAGEGFDIDSGGEGGEGCGLAVAEVVLAGERELRKLLRESAGLFDNELRSFAETIAVVARYATAVGGKSAARMVGKGQKLCSVCVARQFAGHIFVVGPIDEVVFRLLVADDAHFRFDVALHHVAVAIEVVGGDVEQHGDIRAKIVHVVELEGGDFEYKPVGIALFVVLCHAQGHGAADVTGEFHVIARFAQDVVR